MRPWYTHRGNRKSSTYGKTHEDETPNGIGPLFYFVGFRNPQGNDQKGQTGGIRTSTLDVKFLDRRKTDRSESICQECFL